MESRVESIAVEKTGRPLRLAPREKVGVIIVDSFPALGTLTAARFLEWARENPEGVVALPTGKTPEHFIKETRRFLHGWGRRTTQRELAQYGVEAREKCDLRGLRFVQIDEFYPIDPLQHNSFHYYVHEFYIGGFGLDPSRAMLIDCSRVGLQRGTSLKEVWLDDAVDLSLRHRQARSKQERLQRDVIERIDTWCMEYEARVRACGGIGFFLGGIGPDGHIGFNVRGSDFYSTTRLTAVNYETQAAAATDLGGIEVASRRLVITVGLATITFNPECVAVIIAAGEAKAAIVRDAIESERSIRVPATALHVLEGARFYLTKGAAKDLGERRVAALRAAEPLAPREVERVVIDLAVNRRKRVLSLTREDFEDDRCAAAVLERSGLDAGEICAGVVRRLEQGIEAGSRLFKDAVFLHTEPHHDDLMLGCLPFIVRHVREHGTKHHFATLTSGFTAVTNAFMLKRCRRLLDFMGTEGFAALVSEGYFSRDDILFRNRDVWQYLDGVAAESSGMRSDGEMRRLYRNLTELYGETSRETLRGRVEELIGYFETQYPGGKDPDHIQKLKGMCREWEADCLWGYFGWRGESVRHLRLGFYTGDVFAEEPTVGRDVLPVVKLLNEVRPDVITLALDPEASGPDTHYKVLQIITESLRIYEEQSGRREIIILGYRNVWQRFHLREADVIVPVSLNMFALQRSSFLNTFMSQRDASFPSHEHDGPFCELAQKIQVQQYHILKTCLGRAYFHEHPSALIRATRGLVFLSRMDLDELYRHSRELRKTTENV
ncbi:MAG: glucosamine-6-phosphate deaminase [Candidatus Krumholzibacteria bacterium]|nr:glucosamine-6-phosphate deaminase [Candidatus Krumholzibacteria bacterium]